MVWSIVGAGGATEHYEVEAARNLAEKFPNFTGVMMDDFFSDPATGKVAVHDVESLDAIQTQLTVADRKLDLWVVLYNHQLEHPVGPHLETCDVSPSGRGLPTNWWIWRKTSNVPKGLHHRPAKYSAATCTITVVANQCRLT